MTKKKKIALAIICPFASILVIALVVILALWGNVIRSISSIKQIAVSDASRLDGNIYEMTVYGGYDFDKFLERGGAKTDSELISFITESVTKGLIKMNIGESNIGCSSFTAINDENGHRVFGRNYDFRQTNTCIVHTKPGKGRHASVSTIDLEFIGIKNDSSVNGISDKVLMMAAPFVPLDGVNDAGVACGIYMSYQGGEKTIATNQNTEKPDLTSTTMLRMILDYADSVDEAVELVKKYDLHDSANTSFHYMVADKDGNSAILEWVAGTDSTDNDGSKRQLNVIYNKGNFQTVTNYIITEGYYDGEPEDSMAGLDRNNYLIDELSSTDGHVTDTDHALELLKTIGRRNWKPKPDACTVHSVVFDLTDCTAVWVGNEHFGEDNYTKYLKAGK